MTEHHPSPSTYVYDMLNTILWCEVRCAVLITSSCSSSPAAGRGTCVQDHRSLALDCQSTASEAAVCVSAAWAGLQRGRLVRPSHQVM